MPRTNTRSECSATSEYDYTYLSFGGGVQSTALLAMSNLGLKSCPRATIAIFADTQCEPQWVYENLAFMESWSSIPITRVTIGNLGEHFRARLDGTRRRAASIPAWTIGVNGRPAPLWRQCTQEYKVVPIIKRVRELLGYRPRQSVKERVACMLGISLEEIYRMKRSRARWTTNTYPLIEARMRRSDCVELLRELGIPVPLRSACVFCPYHSDEYWHDLQQNHVDEWVRAVEFDRALRKTAPRGFRSPLYVHRSCVPLEMIEFSAQVPDSFGEECDGHCGI
jgi:PP-loop superfamily ATP-utilizing enzyme